ncbi:hypothetical protein DSECCO2_511790 [anaerobic digester metagenome]
MLGNYSITFLWMQFAEKPDKSSWSSHDGNLDIIHDENDTDMKFKPKMNLNGLSNKKYLFTLALSEKFVQAPENITFKHIQNG